MNVPGDIEIIYFEHAGVFLSAQVHVFVDVRNFHRKVGQTRRLMLCVRSSILPSLWAGPPYCGHRSREKGGGVGCSPSTAYCSFDGCVL